MNKFVPILFLICLCFMQVIFGQQKTISGVKIEKDATWNGTIVIEGDVTVAKDARLTIEPGTKVLFRPKSDKMSSGKDKTRNELIVKGILIAKGEYDNKVLFSSAAKNPQMGDWYGIRLLNPSQKSIIDYVIIEYAYNGISIKKSNPQIRNSQIRLNYNAGILTEVKAEPLISKNTIAENGYAGIISSLGSKPILSNNLISLNKIGIIAFSLSQPNLGNLGNSQKRNEGNNNIFENSEFDLYNHTNLTLLAENNSWGTNSSDFVSTRIYDKQDDSRYGLVDFLPFSQQRNLDDLIQLAQAGETQTQTLKANTTPNANQLVNREESQTVKNAEENKPAQKSLLAENPQSNENSEPDPEAISTDQNLISGLNVIPESAPIEQPILNVAKVQRHNEPQIDYNQIFFEYFLDQKKAQLLQKAAPQVTNSALGLGAKGKVIVRIVVGTSGSVEDALVIQGLNSYYDKLSIEAAQKFRYNIGTIKNVPVRFFTNIFFEF